MACDRRRVWRILLSLAVYYSTTVDGSRVRRDSCRARHLSRAEIVDGLCMPVQECIQSLKDVETLRSPIFCGLRGLRPIVCCPLPEEPTTTSATITTTAAATTTSSTSAQLEIDPCQTESGQRGTCIPLFKCKELEEQINQGKYPPLCSIQDRILYACCKRNETQPLEPIQEDVSARALKTSELDYENGVFCGKTTPRPEDARHVVPRLMVIGGINAARDSYPFAVAIFRDKLTFENFQCGGTLITRSVVLSAAHCFYNTPNDTQYLCRIGDVNIREESEDWTVERNVTSVLVHPDYNEGQHYADVALLMLDRSALGEGLNRPLACLPDAAAEPDKDQAIVLGWGHNAFGGRVQTHLQEAKVLLVANDVCNESYSSLLNYVREFPRGINNDFVCAGNITYGGVDACQQDSGGPLVIRTMRNGEHVLEVIRIVSFGVGCGSANFPGVYARVSTYRNWILNKMTQVLPDSQIGLNTELYA
ncbi:clotting factor G beta subunit [Ixodes scapularis]|uniref:clotting factor G beta subunit n=1 Tax=Ixodes scapularis TaxID=6945 RepID=UPI001A9CCAF9|nr:clotting factor G beta subunit [Ixodes scapularis]